VAAGPKVESGWRLRDVVVEQPVAAKL
jgi:hypothetical protein